MHRCTPSPRTRVKPTGGQFPLPAKYASLARIPYLPSTPGFLKFLLFLRSDMVLLHYKVCMHLQTGCLMTIFFPHQLRIF